jgi:hypothetical protein
MLAWLFKKVTFTCTHCDARQRIPLRRIHFFERFHDLHSGEPLLIRCHDCMRGLQTPGPYRTHTGHHVEVDPQLPPKHAFIHEHFP